MSNEIKLTEMDKWGLAQLSERLAPARRLQLEWMHALFRAHGVDPAAVDPGSISVEGEDVVRFKLVQGGTYTGDTNEVSDSVTPETNTGE